MDTVDNITIVDIVENVDTVENVEKIKNPMTDNQNTGRYPRRETGSAGRSFVDEKVRRLFEEGLEFPKTQRKNAEK